MAFCGSGGCPWIVNKPSLMKPHLIEEAYEANRRH